jgi:DNA-binding transcriptional ArsR family regulator
VSDEYKKNNKDEESYDPDNEGSDELKNLFRDLRKEIHDEFQDLRQEIDQVRDSAPERRKKSYERRRARRRERDLNFGDKPFKDWGENIGSSLEHYIGSILESVWDSIDQSVGSLFQTPASSRKGREKGYRRQKVASIQEEDLEDFYLRGAELLSALSDQKRLRMLKELEKEPLRQSDLSEKTDIKGGNFKHHISILKDEGLVHQEGVRERYMLTFAGREALKLAEFLYQRAKKPTGIPIVIDDKDTESDFEEEE